MTAQEDSRRFIENVTRNAARSLSVVTTVLAPSMAVQPSLDLRVSVRGVVIGNQVNLFDRGSEIIDQAQEL